MITNYGYLKLLENLTYDPVNGPQSGSSKPTPDALIKYLAVGNGTAAPTVNDTGLSGTQQDIFPVTFNIVPAGRIQVLGIVPFDRFNGYTISEVGLITKDNDLFARQVLPDDQRHQKSVDMQVSVYWDVIAYGAVNQYALVYKLSNLGTPSSDGTVEGMYDEGTTIVLPSTFTLSSNAPAGGTFSQWQLTGASLPYCAAGGTFSLISNTTVRPEVIVPAPPPDITNSRYRAMAHADFKINVVDNSTNKNHQIGNGKVMQIYKGTPNLGYSEVHPLFNSGYPVASDGSVRGAGTPAIFQHYTPERDYRFDATGVTAMTLLTAFEVNAGLYVSPPESFTVSPPSIADGTTFNNGTLGGVPCISTFHWDAAHPETFWFTTTYTIVDGVLPQDVQEWVLPSDAIPVITTITLNNYSS